jgi:hypothetical protein
MREARMLQNFMTRRQWLALAATALAFGCKQQEPDLIRLPRKKGLCLSSKKRSPQEVARLVESVGARWLYNWSIDPPETLPAGVEFIPMIYGGRSLTDEVLALVKTRAPVHGYREVLGFNEPDAKAQGNTSVDKALELWPKLESTGLRLGSPACVHPDNEWMKTFMEGVDQRGLRVDIVCMHSYGGPNADSLVKRIENVHALYKRPIWITEFAVGDWQAKSPAENRHKPGRIAEFVAELLPRLEAMDIVERYAWFHGGISGNALGTSSLFNPDGSFTLVGEAYRSVG